MGAILRLRSGRKEAKDVDRPGAAVGDSGLWAEIVKRIEGKKVISLFQISLQLDIVEKPQSLLVKRVHTGA